MIHSDLYSTLSDLTTKAASAIVARGRIASPGLNSALLRRLSAAAGDGDSLLADPEFEISRTWEMADCTMADLSGELLHSDLVNALAVAEQERVPPERKPWTHQFDSWKAAQQGMSCLVTAGTGSGKTEAFMVPILDDLVRDSTQGKLSGVRAILIYPLNALIQSQRERLAAWTEHLQHRVSFALYNGLTPETRRQTDLHDLASAEIGNRREIREQPPSILVTNVTMLEYLLLRAQDRSILERSHGLLRWIVLDEAHTYIGAQAAEMALLLRRVRAAFGVDPDDVRLMATSATISDDTGSKDKLTRFMADLAGINAGRVKVIEGQPVEPKLPKPCKDAPISPHALEELDSIQLWHHLAPHPRIQRIQHTLSERSISLTDVSQLLFGDNASGRRKDAQVVLDASAQAVSESTGEALLPWRAHVFIRSQGGIWVCIDGGCPHRDAELAEKDSGWDFGAIWLKHRDRCTCGSPTFELVTCDDCGTPLLRAGLEVGATARLVPLRSVEVDEFAIDAEPDEESDTVREVVRGTAIVSPSKNDSNDRFVAIKDGVVYDNAAPEDSKSVRLSLYEDEHARGCCSRARAAFSSLSPHRYGPAFLMGTTVPMFAERLSNPLEQPGLPLGGRRALTFSDSRQGTARLAAKLQQDAERNLTRSFLYHVVQENTALTPEERNQVEHKLKVLRPLNDPAFDDMIQNLESKLSDNDHPIDWAHLLDRFSQQVELSNFATDVWRKRAGGGREMSNDPRKLAMMFLYRELYRRPKIQNNAETMGLARLSFPSMEKKARADVPRVMEKAGIDADGWIGLALSSIDFVFRQNLAVQIPHEWMLRFVSPRRGRQPNSICLPSLHSSERPPGGRPWPSAVPTNPSRPNRLQRLIYQMIGGDWESAVDQGLAEEVLAQLWDLLTSTVVKDIGAGAFQLDFERAAVARLTDAWLCPVSRRVFGYSPAGLSPYDPGETLIPITLPRPPAANAGGLDRGSRSRVGQWCEVDQSIEKLRNIGVWTNLHDRVATYAPFLRAQEHSAQILRPVLADYEDQFKKGKINLLNCSTTMEMGVDIPDVQMVVNANVPPSISNYRQRVGRGGRRGEPWSFGVTFCRNLPLDESVFSDPAALLAAPVTVPAVRFDSERLIIRHVHATLLAEFLRGLPEGFKLQASTGSFFGATDDPDRPVNPESPADTFLAKLRGDWLEDESLQSNLKRLTARTVLHEKNVEHLVEETAGSFESMLLTWRREYAEILDRREAAAEPEVKGAFRMRANRMKGEFLLSELARRGFTPSYGFPVDVVTFDHLSGHDSDSADEAISFGEFRGAPSRTLDIAIREYAPGAEVVVDGLVHRSEGVFPAWGAMADTSNLEDLQDYWECGSCRFFDLSRLAPANCPHCEAPIRTWKPCLIPAGFLGRRHPHTGYENLGHATFEMPKLTAGGIDWWTLPDPNAGRLRANPNGKVVTLGSGAHGNGYALCLDCGRAEPEKEDMPSSPLPTAIKKHRPLAESRRKKLVEGYCPGGFTELSRIKRNVRLSHATATDVFEFQLPPEATPKQGLALSAALREALAIRIGAEPREIGVAVAPSTGPNDEPRWSSFLFDRASGGAGLVLRLFEQHWFDACIGKAVEKLTCPEDCENGCPACVLRPDLNFERYLIDRKGGLELASWIKERLQIPDEIRVFGPDTQLLSSRIPDWIETRGRSGELSAVTIYFHGEPSDWELDAWDFANKLGNLRRRGVVVNLAIEGNTLTSSLLGLPQQLGLHRLSADATLVYVRSLPRAGRAFISAIISGASGQVAIAAFDQKDVIPGPIWGAGSECPLVQGPPGKLPDEKEFSSDRLIFLSSGNATVIRLSDRLNGWVSAFGKKFWKALADEVPLTVAAMERHGVTRIAYTDRYLLTPLAIRLLFEVVRNAPGAKNPEISLLTARLTTNKNPGWSVYHTFDSDVSRQDLLQGLFPQAAVDIQSKGELPHDRSLKLGLGDGRQVVITLDQGFGAWRAAGRQRYDFNAPVERQARALISSRFRVRVESGRKAPVVVEA